MKTAFTLWFTGLPSAGKTTLADAVAAELGRCGLAVERLDGDALRRGVSKHLSFSPEDRNRHAANVARMAAEMNARGTVAVVALITPYRAGREAARAAVGEFVEVYVRCPLEVCESRDPKGLYRRARSGEIGRFTGISDPYEEPESPEVVVDTGRYGAAACVGKVLSYLTGRYGLPASANVNERRSA